MYGNRACERILGFDPASDLAGKDAWDLQATSSSSSSAAAAEVGDTLREEEEEEENGEQRAEEQQQSASSRGRDAVRQRLERGQQWEGTLNSRRKTGDSVPLDSVAIPVSFGGGRGKKPDHIVYVKQPPLLLRDKSLTDAATDGGRAMAAASAAGGDGYQPRHSGGSSGSNSLTAISTGAASGRKNLRSFRNASCDVGSLLADRGGGGGGGAFPGGGALPSSSSSHVVSGGGGARRQSVAKMQHHTVEAPITKVIGIILAAQENSPQYIAQALDKVITAISAAISQHEKNPTFSLSTPQVLDILQTTDSINLFSPEVEREKRKRTDAVTTDLLGALLAVRQRVVDPQ